MMPPLTPQQQQATTSPTDLVLGIGIVIGVAYLAGKLFIGYRKVVPAAQKILIRTGELPRSRFRARQAYGDYPAPVAAVAAPAPSHQARVVRKHKVRKYDAAALPAAHAVALPAGTLPRLPANRGTLQMDSGPSGKGSPLYTPSPDY